MNLKNISIEKIVRNGLLILTIVGFVAALNYTLGNLTSPRTNNMILALPFISFLAPYLAMSLYGVKRVESKMLVIPRFLRDIVDNVESGMDLVSSIKVTTGNEYGVLNDDIKRMSNQLSWGVDFETAFLRFAKNVGSKDLYRDFLLIVEARRIGGHAEKILRELSLKIGTENLRKKERKSNLSSNTFTGYISFLIFVFIIVLVYNNLFLGLGNSLTQNSLAEGETPTASGQTSLYLTLLIFLSYELAILSGFLFGLMQENNIISGAPHVVVLVIMTFIGFLFFIKY